MHSLSDYEVISSLPDSENSFKVEDKVDGGFKALHIVEYKDLGDFHTQSLLSRLLDFDKADANPHHIKYFQHFIKKDCFSICLIMELADGVPLSHFVGRCREENLQFEESYIWRVMAQLSSAINVSRGTLTLKNVFIDKKGDVKWNSLISEDSTVPLRSQLGSLATEMCTAGESTYIPSFYTKDLRIAISSLVLGEEISFKPITNKEFPKLYPRIPEKPDFFEALIKSNPNIYESVIYSDKTRSSPNNTQSKKKHSEADLKFRIQAIKAQEALLRQKELNLILKENELIEREKRIEETEKRIMSEDYEKEKPSVPKRPPKTKPFEFTYMTKDETTRPPTVAKLKIPPLPPRIKTIQQQKKLSFKSPKKFIKYDIELKPSSTSIPSISSEESDAITKRKSILSILGLNPPRPIKIPETQGELDDFKIKVSGIAKWTSENKKAAFDMLAAMNAKGSVVASKGSSQRIYERSRSRRSCYGLKTSF
ncbi:hypothetical protein ACFFRR_002054 [Megaselia abdita]